MSTPGAPHLSGGASPSSYASTRVLLERHHPGWLGAMMPKRYSDVPTEYQLPFTWAAAAMGAACHWSLAPTDTTCREVYGQAMYLRALDVPMLFVSAELARAALRTELPADLPADAIRFGNDGGFGGAIFMLPRGVLVHATEGSCPYLAITRMPPGQPFYPPIMEMGPLVIARREAIVITTSQAEHSVNFLYDRVIHAGSPGRTLCEALTEIGMIRMEVDADLLETSENAVADSSTYIERASHLALVLTLLLLNSADLIEPGRLLKRVAPKRPGEPTKEFWSPSFLGRLFKMETRVDAGAGEATGRSHRPHFVRGHLKQQAHGPARSLRKLLWIQPYRTGS